MSDDDDRDRAAAIGRRYAAVIERVYAACARAGRDPKDVAVIAVSKWQPASAIYAMWAAGGWDVGENYAQELAAKQADVKAPVIWHFVGRLQRNKAKLVAGKVELVHAVDSLELAVELGKRAIEADGAAAMQPILIAVNLAGETTKGGVAAAELPALARAILATAGVRLDGLMTMPPPADDPEASRAPFAALRALRDRLADDLGVALPALSMGMSDDFEVAIAEGATHVRIGTAIFGERPPR